MNQPDPQVTTTIFVPRGKATELSILNAAKDSVRDQIPLNYDLNPQIVGVSDPKMYGDTEGREYTIVITCTPR